MKSNTNYLLMGLCFAGLSGPLSGPAATIWNGPTITFTQAAPYPNPGDRDQLTPNVSLTRAAPVGGGTGGIFNGVTETRFTKLVSPADTEWAVGSLADYATLTYTDWTTVAGGHPVHHLVGQQLVVHLITDDIYLSLQFTSLPSGPGLSYIRSTPASAVRLAVQESGGLLDISWPVAGGRLETQTNSPGVGIGTNWVTVPGSTTTNHVVVPIDPANGSACYRLAFP